VHTEYLLEGMVALRCADMWCSYIFAITWISYLCFVCLLFQKFQTTWNHSIHFHLQSSEYKGYSFVKIRTNCKWEKKCFLKNLRSLDELAMCACRSKGQPHPGWHQAKCDQEVEGGDSAPLLCSCETPPGVLHPVLVLTTQEGHGVVE